MILRVIDNGGTVANVMDRKMHTFFFKFFNRFYIAIKLNVREILFGLVRHRKMSEYSLKIKSVGKFVYGAKKFFHGFLPHFIVLNRKAET